jgi:hypothetical protein
VLQRLLVPPLGSLWLVLLLCGCGGGFPRPRHAVSPRAAYGEVPYPPPAALSELVPPQPRRTGVVFADGGWAWLGRYYVWERGGWVAPAPGQGFAPSTLEYLPDGRMRFAPGTWVDTRGSVARPPPILVPATTPPNEITPEFETSR